MRAHDVPQSLADFRSVVQVTVRYQVASVAVGVRRLGRAGRVPPGARGGRRGLDDWRRQQAGAAASDLSSHTAAAFAHSPIFLVFVEPTVFSPGCSIQTPLVHDTYTTANMLPLTKLTLATTLVAAASMTGAHAQATTTDAAVTSAAAADVVVVNTTTATDAAPSATTTTSALVADAKPEDDWGPLRVEHKRLATHLENLEPYHDSKRIKKVICFGQFNIVAQPS